MIGTYFPMPKPIAGEATNSCFTSTANIVLCHSKGVARIFFRAYRILRKGHHPTDASLDDERLFLKCRLSLATRDITFFGFSLFQVGFSAFQLFVSVFRLFIL